MNRQIESALPVEVVASIGATLSKEEEKVTVIIPVYNVCSFVGKCIESVIAQRYSNLEIILVNDGSQDGSGEICDQYAEKDRRIRVIHKENGGVSAARNSGLDVATGEWICFVDGDDFVFPDYVGYMLAMAKKHDAEIALTTRMFGNFDGVQTEHDVIRVWTAEDAVEAILCYNVPIGCYCKIFKKSFLDGVRFIPEVFIGEGFNFNVAAFQKATKVVSGCMKVYYYRRDNPTSAMTKFSIKKCECGLKALQIIRDNLVIHTDRIDKAWEFANWRTHSDFYDMFVLAKVQKEYPDIYRGCLAVTREKAMTAFKVPTSKQNKIRAIVMLICPALIPLAMQLRKLRFNVKVDNR